MIRLPPTSPLFPTRRSSDLVVLGRVGSIELGTLGTDEVVVGQVGGGGPTDDHAVPQRPRPRHIVVVGRASAAHLSYDDLVGADRQSTRLNSRHSQISYAVFC